LGAVGPDVGGDPFSMGKGGEKKRKKRGEKVCATGRFVAGLKGVEREKKEGDKPEGRKGGLGWPLVFALVENLDSQKKGRRNDV